MVIDADMIARLTERVELQQHLRPFMRAGWHVLERKSFCDGWHIGAICEHLEAVIAGEIEYLIINMPPRHCKTLSVSVFWPAWVWTFAPWKRWLFASYAQTLSSEAARKFRKLVTSPWYQARWGHQFSLSGDQNTKLEIVNDQNGHRIATAAKASGTGKGGDIVVADDPNKVGHAESKARREEVNTWWREEIGTREDTGDETEESVARVIVQQRVHHRDVTGDALKSLGAIALDLDVSPPVHLCLPAEYEGNKTPNAFGFVDPRTEQGELLWPAGCSAKRLAKIKATLGSPYAIAGQLQQRPVPRGGGIIREEWIRTFQEAPRTFARAAVSVDASHGSTSSTASHNVFVFVVEVGADVYVLKLERFRGGLPELIKRLKAFIAEAQAFIAARGVRVQLEVLIENKVNGRSAIQTMQRAIPGIVPVDPGSRDKETRLEACAVRYEAGNVRVLAHAAWREVFVFEHCAFPKAGSDDIVDAMTQVIERFSAPRARLVVGGRVLD